MSKHATISPSKAADRLAIRETVEAYTDTFKKVDGAWLLSDRILCADWIEERSL